MEPGLQVAGREGPTVQPWLPQRPTAHPWQWEVVVTAALQGQEAAGSLAGCHTAVSTYCAQGKGLLRLPFRRWLGL